jgi:hypothetical protein
MKKMLLIFMLMMTSMSIFATQVSVVGEIFTATT